MHRIGVDLGGTNIAAGIVAADGSITHKKSIPFVQKDQQGLVDDIIGLCQDLLEMAALTLTEIESIGIGVPGIVNPPEGMILAACNLNVEKMPISHLVGQVLKVPIFLDNDANCAALGEAAFGAAKNSKYSITITLGTGIGGGIILDGKVYSGPFFTAAEMHHVIRAEGEMCSCGRRGCWEEYAAARGLVREATRWGERLSTSLVLEMAGGDASKVTAKMVFDAADAGDSLAVYALEVYLDNLSIGLGNLVNILQPEIIVIGGGMSGKGQSLIHAIESRMPDMVYGRDVRTKFVIAELGNDAGIVGAALLNN